MQLVINNIEIELVRKKMKTIRVAIYRATGKVRVSAPIRMPEAVIKQFLVERLPWIEKHKAKAEAVFIPAPPKYVTGETHYFQGQPYFLNVLHQQTSRPRVSHQHTEMHLYVHADCNEHERHKVIMRWYKKQLDLYLPAIISKWEQIIGVTVTSYGIRQMKTRWGSCNIRKRHISINLELAKKSIACLEYIVVHELIHLLERYHNARFYAFMNQYLPTWRHLEAELNRPVHLDATIAPANTMAC